MVQRPNHVIDVDREDLCRRWDALWARLHVPPDRAPKLDPLLSAYDQPRRAYHNIRHISQCLHELDAMRELCEQPDTVELAIWYHDAVYDSTRHDNEDRSAALASNDLHAANLPDKTVHAVHELILATKHSQSPVTRDAQLLADIDLSILGQERDVFDEYERGIRQEYAHVEENAFRAGRGKILETFIARQNIFSTPRMREKFEERARENLARSIARLRM
jgi:predicted metal-dependent HD superfamily phosphohydrolase